MSFTALMTALLLNPFAALPDPTGCYSDETTGLVVCTQPVEPSPLPDVA